MFEEVVAKYFSGMGVALSKSFARYTAGAISACSFSTHEISRHVSQSSGKDFNTSEKGLIYLLSNKKFQIDDHYWRMHVNMIFDFLSEQELISKNKKIYIQVDFTSNEDHFLILSASIIVNNRAIPLFFTMRNYPKRENQYNHKKMEQAFLKGLKHILSKKYQYVIVADRGFGNQRFIDLCEENQFEYLIRITPNLKVKKGEEESLMNEAFQEDGCQLLEVVKWQKMANICRVSNLRGEWHLVSNIKGIDKDSAETIYKDRFKIEKCFQDMKSSGFDIERSKIRKYDRYKKLLAICMLSHALLVLLGHLVVTKLPHFLKNSALMASVILAYFQSEENLSIYFPKNNLTG
jgi:hypothetical protein